ncbi:hypothetical protein IMSAGC022_00572 [Alistipes sp.]|nr:hypothetical protein IMSAGC022_00572 [Alistipes sp.]
MMDGHTHSLDETEIINQIGAAYSLSGQNEKAAGIFGQLLSYVQGHYEDVTRPSRYLSLISHNYARELCLLGHYEKAIEIAEVGRMSCLKYGYCQFLPGLLAIAAKCWYFLKEELRKITLRKEILSCSSMYARTTGEERELFRADAQKKIKELECIAKKDDVVSRQFLAARNADWIEEDGGALP